MKVSVSFERTLSVVAELPSDVDPKDFERVSQFVDWDDVEMKMEDQTINIYDVEII